MEIVKYKFFKSSKEFEKWQKKGQVKIINVVPVIKESVTTEALGTTDIEYEVFVTYFEETKENDEN